LTQNVGFSKTRFILNQELDLKIIIIICGFLAVLITIIAFQALQRSMKVAWAHNTLHLILIAWGIAMILYSGAVLLLSKQLDPLYD